MGRDYKEEERPKEQAISEFPFARNRSYENDFDLHEKETACRTNFHMKGFVFRLVLKQRHMRTQKWPIEAKRKGGQENGATL